MKYLLGIIFLVLCFSTSGAYQLSQDFVGVGSVNSEIRSENFKSVIRAESGEFAIGNQVTQDSSFSGFHLINGLGGVYRVNGQIADLSHSININDASAIFLTSKFERTSQNANEMDNNDETISGGSSIISGNFTGDAIEKIRSVKYAGCKGNKPLDLSTIRVNGTFEINSKVEI